MPRPPFDCVLCHTDWHHCKNPYAHKKVTRWYLKKQTPNPCCDKHRYGCQVTYVCTCNHS